MNANGTRTIRLPDDLWAWLQQDAERYGRTVAQSVRFYLMRAQARTEGRI